MLLLNRFLVALIGLELLWIQGRHRNIFMIIVILVLILNIKTFQQMLIMARIGNDFPDGSLTNLLP